MFFANKKFIFFAFAGVVLFVAFIFLEFYIGGAKNSSVEIPSESKGKAVLEVVQDTANEKNGSQISSEAQPFQSPLTRAGERVTKKKFGQYITPQNSPVQPERFSGYHTGADFEIFPEELNADVPVVAVCGGKITVKRAASGYGGILAQDCILESQPITALYGHLKLASITKKAGDSISQGEEIGILGKAYSAETDGERKHLHLGVHKGSGIDIRGYVQNQSEFSGWIDPCSLELICR